MRAFIFSALLIFPLCAQAQSEQTNHATIPIRDLFGDLGVTGDLVIDSIAPDGDRCAISVTIAAPALLSEIDRLGRAQGNVGSSRNRLYWVGPTRLREVQSPGYIFLSSRARYESWTYVDLGFDTVKTKNFQDTKGIDLRLSVVWNNETDTLALSYEIQNIRNFPGALETALRRIGLRFGGSSTLDLPKTTEMERLDPEITAGPTFQPSTDGKGLTINAIVTANLPKIRLIDSCVALRSILAAEPERLSSFIVSLIEEM